MGTPDSPPKLNGKQINVMLSPLPVNKRKPKFHVRETPHPAPAKTEPESPPAAP
jgi:translation initiation factor IF-3